MSVRLLIFSNYLLHYSISGFLNLLQSTLTYSNVLVWSVSQETLVMLKTSESQFWPGPAQPVLVLFYAALFLLLHGKTAWSRVTKVTVYEQTSGPANWSQHHHWESESVLSEWERSQSISFFSPLIHITACSITWAIPGPVGLGCWCNLTWPGPDQALAACSVTSARGLSLPLCSHLASSSLRLYFPIPLSKGLSLLASSCHAQTHFSLNRFFMLLCSWNQHYYITFIWQMLLSKATYSKCKPRRSKTTRCHQKLGVYHFQAND